LALSLLAAAPPRIEWHYREGTAFKAAQEQGKALFVFSRAEWDLRSRWIEQNALARPDVQPLLTHYICAQLWVGSKCLRDAKLTAVGFAFFEPNRQLLSTVEADAPHEELVAELRTAHRRVGEATRLREKLTTSPKDSEILRKLIDELTARRDFKGTLAQFKSLQAVHTLSRDEAAERDHIALRVKMGAKAHKDASALAESFLTQHSGSALISKAAAIAASAYGKQRQYDRAIAVLNRVLDLRPYAEGAPELAYRLGLLYHATGKTDQAGETMDMILKRWPTSPVARQTALRQAKALWLGKGKPEQALALLRRALSPGPANGSRTMDYDVAATAARSIERSIAAEPTWQRAGQTTPAAANVLVLVPDVSTFLHYVSRWDRECFFPVLFDEPKFARKFVAAYRPKKLLYARAVAPAPITDSLVQKTVRAAEGRGASAGAVVSALDAPQLPAAVALAAAREQILLLANGNAKPTKPSVTFDEKERLRRWLMSSIAARGVAYDDLCDSIDFVTLAIDWPTRYNVSKGIFPGTRSLDDAITRRDDERRFAFCGRLLGDRDQTTYQAMCSLFLKPRRALLFNTYGGRSGTVWQSYRMDGAAEQLTSLMEAKYLAGGAATVAKWHQEVAPLASFGLVCVNSSGGRTNWSVPGGGGTTDDVPDTAPCLVHFTHSGSACAPHDPNSIAGRWLTNGAYLYFGSLAEPYLTSFVTPHEYTQRLCRGWPTGVAFRRLFGESFWAPWRLWLLGDPLATLSAESRSTPSLPSLPADPVDTLVARLEASLGQKRETEVLARLASIAFVRGDDLRAAAYAAQCAPDSQTARVQYIRLASLLAQQRLDEIRKLSPKVLGRDAAILWRTALVALVHDALSKGDVEQAAHHTRVIAATAVTTSFLSRTVKAIRPLCKIDGHRAALSALCRDLAELRPKDKRLIDTLTKIGGPK